MCGMQGISRRAAPSSDTSQANRGTTAAALPSDLASAESTPAAHVEAFALALFEPGDLVEIRCIGGVGGTWRGWRPASDFASAEVLERLARANESGANIYIGINPRKRKGGAAEDVALARAVWVDLDGGVTPEEARRRVREANLPEPSLMVRSGNGVHVYWRLETPHADLGDWSARMKGLIAAVGGDPVIHDPPRIMRLPGFDNTKREVRVRCEVVEAWPDRRYAPEAFPLPAAPRAAPAAARVSRPPTGVQRVGQSTANFVRFGAAYGERNSSLFRAACDLAGCGLAIESAETLLGPAAVACGLGAEEISRTIRSAFSRDRAPVAGPAEPEVEFITGDRLVREYRSLREPVLEGLLRAGEVMNVVAAPKVGKSWLVHGLALSAASGTRWLGREVRRAPVLIIDAELHHETLAHRLEQVANHSEAGPDALAGVEVWPLRGKRIDIDWVQRRLEADERRYGLIVVDALYRFMPLGSEENSNEAMTSVYNTLDAIAERSGASVVVVHHTSKGDQSLKAVTDIGSGAGAQSRAADTHLVLRHHQEDGAVVVDAAVRSWKPVEPYVLAWNAPGWKLAPDLDPSLLRKQPRRPKAASEAEQGRSAPVDWTPSMFASDVVGPVPRIREDILARAKERGLSNAKAGALLRRAEEERLVHRHNVQNEPHRFSTSTLAGAPLKNVWDRGEGGGGGGGGVSPPPPVLFAPGGMGGTPTPPSPPPIPPEHGEQWGRV